MDPRQNTAKPRRHGMLATLFVIAACLAMAPSRPAHSQTNTATPTSGAPQNTASAGLFADAAATPNSRPIEIDRGSVGLLQTLRKLHTRASLLMVTAHPDDEDGGMLAYETRGPGRARNADDAEPR